MFFVSTLGTEEYSFIKRSINPLTDALNADWFDWTHFTVPTKTVKNSLTLLVSEIEFILSGVSFPRIVFIFLRSDENEQSDEAGGTMSSLVA